MPHLQLGQIETPRHLFHRSSITTAIVSLKHQLQCSFSMDLISTPTALSVLHGDVLAASRQERMNAACTATDVGVENIFKLDAKSEESDRLERFL